MIRFFIVAFWAAMLASTPVLAGEVWSDRRKVTAVYPEGSGLTFFVDGPVIGGTCSGANTTRLQILQTDPNYEAKVSGILLAFSAQFDVIVLYDDTTLGSCAVHVNRFHVTR